MKTGFSTVALALLLSTFGLAKADTVTYPGFGSTAGLTFAGNAATASTADGTVLRLVPAVDYQSGAVYSTTPVTLGAGNAFSTQFQFRISDPGGYGPADGLTFVLAASPNGLGGNGGALGYGGVGNSLAVEYDTYDNGTDNNDPNGNHVGVDVDGSLTSLVTGTPYGQTNCSGTGAAGCLSDGDLWTTTITYDGTYLNVSVQDGNGQVENLISNYAVDAGSYLGTNTAYVGFTGGTGAGNENEDIVNWEFANTSTLPTAATPEPSSLVLLGTGLMGVLAAARRRRFGW